MKRHFLAPILESHFLYPTISIQHLSKQAIFHLDHITNTVSCLGACLGVSVMAWKMSVSINLSLCVPIASCPTGPLRTLVLSKYITLWRDKMTACRNFILYSPPNPLWSEFVRCKAPRGALHVLSYSYLFVYAEQLRLRFCSAQHACLHVKCFYKWVFRKRHPSWYLFRFTPC